MNARAYDIMEENKKKVNADFVGDISESKEEEILKEAKGTIDEIWKLHKTLKERKKIKEKEMDKALAAAKTNYEGMYFSHILSNRKSALF